MLAAGLFEVPKLINLASHDLDSVVVVVFGLLAVLYILATSRRLSPTSKPCYLTMRL